MSDRLDELQRQRALVQEQLARLDREITAESGGAKPSPLAKPSVLPPDTPPPTHRPTTPRSAPVAPVATRPDVSADEILAKYQVEPQSLQSNVKRGCFMYFFLAFLLLGLFALGLFLYSSRK